MALPTGDVKDSPSDAELYEVGTGDIKEKTLAEAITAGSPAATEVLKLNNTTGLSTNGFLIVKNANLEIIRYEGISGSPVGVTVKERGWKDTDAGSADIGTAVWLIDTSYHHDLPMAYIKEILTGNRTFSSNKTFSGQLKIPGAAPGAPAARHVWEFNDEVYHGMNSRRLLDLDDDALYVKLTGAQTITGAKTISSLILTDGGTIGQAAGPLVTFDDTNNYLEITGCKVEISGTAQQLFINDSGAAADNGLWQFEASGEQFRLAILNDAVSAGATVFSVERTGITVDSLSFPNGNLGIGIGASLLGKLHIDQPSTTAAIPPLVLDQADLSEELIKFITSIGVGNPVEAVGGKTLTTTHFIRVEIPGPAYVYIPVGTIA